MSDHNRVVARAPRERAAVAELGLDVAHDRALVHALGRDEELRIPLIPVRVLELDLRDGRAAPGLVDDGLHDALDVALLFSVVDLAQAHGALAQARVRREDGVLALTGAADGLTHLGLLDLAPRPNVRRG